MPIASERAALTAAMPSCSPPLLSSVARGAGRGRPNLIELCECARERWQGLRGGYCTLGSSQRCDSAATDRPWPGAGERCAGAAATRAGAEHEPRAAAASPSAAACALGSSCWVRASPPRSRRPLTPLPAAHSRALHQQLLAVAAHHHQLVLMRSCLRALAAARPPRPAADNGRWAARLREVRNGVQVRRQRRQRAVAVCVLTVRHSV